MIMHHRNCSVKYIVPLARVKRQLKGIQEIYKSLRDWNASPTGCADVLGLSAEKYEAWVHPALSSRLAAGRSVAVHVAASVFTRGVLLPTGLLIDANVLSYRLGVDVTKSAGAWDALLSKLRGCKYRGMGSKFFDRWWARSVDEWWLRFSSNSLANSTIEERVKILRAKLKLPKLMPLKMPDESPGNRPWRACALSLEEDPKLWIPVDPAFGVRIAPRTDMPIWVDPLYAAYGIARQAGEDFRRNEADLKRVKAKLARAK